MVHNKMTRNRTIAKCGLVGLLLFATVPFSAATPAAPQTARQALIEMFFSPTPGTLDKHLPEVTRAALKTAQAGSSASVMNAFATITSTMQARGQQWQTFETGPTLLSFEDARQHSKVEIMVERDELRADEDLIEVSIHAFKDGETQTGGMKPRFTFTMKQEAGIWRLNEITFALNVSLTDPQMLKMMTTPMRPTLAPVDQTRIQPAANWNATGGGDASTISALRTVITAEGTYAKVYPSRGYTCSLSDLGGMGGADRNEHQAMLIDPRLASGKKNGYHFTLSGCEGSPAAKFTLTAVPAEGSFGTRTFCGDQSGTIRSSSNSNPDSCMASGQPVQ